MKPSPDFDISALFPPSERHRVTDGSKRYEILSERPDDILDQHMVEQVGEERKERLVQSDPARNPAATVCRAMSTPGSYGRAPDLVAEGAEVAAALMTPLWTLKQHAQFLAYGMGSVLVHTDCPEGHDQVVWQVIPHHHVWAIGHRADPRTPVTLYRLRIYRLEVPGEPEPQDHYCWDVYDVSNPEEPAHYVVMAGNDGEIGLDVTEQVLEVGGPDDLVGEGYPYRYSDGTPFLPFVIHRARDDGTMFAAAQGRGFFVGTLQVMALETLAFHTANHASGNITFVFGGKPKGVSVKNRREDGVLVINAEPGDIIYHDKDQEYDGQPLVQQIGPGGNLEALAAYSDRYASNVAADMGLTPTDAIRVGANPMSGVAISLTNANKKMEQRRQRPLCERADHQQIRQAVALARRSDLSVRVGGQLVPVGELAETGYGIVYHEIPEDPTERRTRLEEERHEIEHGLVSPVDLYVKRHPGISRDQAIVALASIRRDLQLIESTATETES